MAIYYDRENGRFTTCYSASSELILDKIQTFSDHSYHKQDVRIENAPIKYIGFDIKNGWKIKGTYKYDDVLYIDVAILHKSDTYLAPMSKLKTYLNDDKSILNTHVTLSSFYFKLDEKIDNWESQFLKVYHDICWVCNTRDVWLYKDMIKFLAEFDQYASNNIESPYFIHVLAEVLKYILKYGRNINEEFLLTGKERLLSYAYDSLENGTKRLNDLMKQGEDDNKLYDSVSEIKEFIDCCRTIWL